MVVKTNSAYLLIVCNTGKLDQVVTQIESLEYIKEIQKTCGAYDIIVKVESETRENLQTFILQKIKTVVDIRSAMALHCNPNLN